MTSSQGYFLHVQTGDLLPVHEHSWTVVDAPLRFGLQEDQVAGRSPITDRIDLLERVLANGWIRIRHRMDEVSVEFLMSWDDTIDAVARAIPELGLGNACWINFRHLGTGESLGVHVLELKESFVDGTINDLLGRIDMR